MNWDTISGNWKQLKGRLREKWGRLTDDDLDVIDGRRIQLLGKIQERYGVARDAAEKQVKEWEEGIVTIERAPTGDSRRDDSTTRHRSSTEGRT